MADVEQTLPLQIVIDASYTGAKGTRLDTITASGLFNQSGFASFFFDYQDSTAFSNFNALTVTTTKRLQNGLALSASLYLFAKCESEVLHVHTATSVHLVP